jgi:hypothetical protein
VFGSLYLANPHLLQRFVAGAPLNAPERETFYTGGPPRLYRLPCSSASTMGRAFRTCVDRSSKAVVIDQGKTALTG